MKIGILSDTHDRVPTFRRALELFRRLEVDAVFHAGDLVAPFAAKLLAASPGGAGILPADTPVHVIYGNNDGEREGLKKVLPQIEDGPLRTTLRDPGGGETVVVMAHFIEWLKPADLAGADVVISGHDHQASIQKRAAGDREVLFVNPGECCGWVTGRCSAAVLEWGGSGWDAKLIDIQG